MSFFPFISDKLVMVVEVYFEASWNLFMLQYTVIYVLRFGSILCLPLEQL